MSMVQSDTSSGIAYTGRAFVGSFSAHGGASGITLNIYDNTAASGTLVGKIQVAANSSQERVFNEPLVCNTGVYAEIGAGGGTWTVELV